MSTHRHMPKRQRIQAHKPRIKSWLKIHETHKMGEWEQMELTIKSVKGIYNVRQCLRCGASQAQNEGSGRIGHVHALRVRCTMKKSYQLSDIVE